MSGRVARPLPGGYRVGEKVFFTGPSETFPSGNKLVHGGQGAVVGPSTSGDGKLRVAVRFPGNKRNVDCYITSVRRLRPPKRPTRRCLRAHAGPARAVHLPQPTPRTSPASHCGVGSAGDLGSCRILAGYRHPLCLLLNARR